MNVLCVVAHPDDEVIGPGGALARHSDEGDDVHVCVLADGVSSRFEEESDRRRKEIRKRRERSEKACEVLGASVSFYEFPDNKFDDVSLLKLVKTIEKEIKSHKPDIIYTHHFGDLNIDHELTCRAVMTAARPLPDSSVEKIMAFETLSSSEWSIPKKSRSFEPNLFRDVREYMPKKKKALSIYQKEMRDENHPRNIKNIERNAKLWGAKCGVGVAEPFELLLGIE